MPTQVHSNSPEETFNFGETMATSLQGDEIILLSGELGAGKTLLTKGIAAGIGINPDEVVSPTFTIMNYYEGKFPLYHIDLYRFGADLKKKKAPLPEIDDHIDEGIIVIEWAQYLPGMYFTLKKAIKVEIRVLDESSRIFIRS